MMYKKIDKSIFNKITNLNRDSSLDIIIRYKSKERAISVLRDLDIKDFTILPFISSVACNIKYKDLYTLAKIKNVTYITSNAKVTSLIFNSKNYLHYENVSSFIASRPKHTCVVIDTGVYPHVDFLLGKKRIIKFVDMINYKVDMYDDNGHGTFVTGVFVGGGIVDNYSGIDSNANVIVIKGLDKNGETTSSKILESMQWILDNKDKYNIKVVCMSFGSVLGGVDDPLIYGAEILWNNGIVVVAAAGNNGPEYSTIMSPGGSKKIITVGSLDITKDQVEVADFSSRGPALKNYKPDIVVPGVDIISTSLYKKNQFYTTMSGTSVSTPMIAGVVSLLFNYNQNYTPDEIKFMLINSTIKINGDRNSEGFGALDLSKLYLI